MTFSEITYESVLLAINEYDKLGKDKFLSEYRFQDARNYFLLFKDKYYPSKAIAGVAHQYISPGYKPLTSSDFSGGKDTVEKKLKELGFTIEIRNIMHFWWVNHKQTHKQELGGGYIWSPKKNRSGTTNLSYENLPKVQINDVIFSYANAQIMAIGIVEERALTSDRPPEFGSTGRQWNTNGWLVKVNWSILTDGIHPKEHLKYIVPLLPEKYSPITITGNGNQAFYLVRIGDDLGKFLLSLSETEETIISGINSNIIQEEENDKEKEILRQTISDTEKEQLVKSRIGQGVYRSQVEVIEKQCRVTGISDKRFLIASHIKPWRTSDNRERLDGNNGLLLSPHVDKLFDEGWITFTNDGIMLIATDFILIIIKSWGINPNMNVGRFNPDQLNYLKYHRNNIYKGHQKE